MDQSVRHFRLIRSSGPYAIISDQSLKASVPDVHFLIRITSVSLEQVQHFLFDPYFLNWREVTLPVPCTCPIGAFFFQDLAISCLQLATLSHIVSSGTVSGWGLTDWHHKTQTTALQVTNKIAFCFWIIVCDLEHLRHLSFYICVTGRIRYLCHSSVVKLFQLCQPCKNRISYQISMAHPFSTVQLFTGAYRGNEKVGRRDLKML